MDRAAESYVRLVLGVGERDQGYVDAYYGPPSWQEQVKAERPSLETLEARAAALSSELDGMDEPDGELERLRLRFLKDQLAAVRTRLQMLGGAKLPFDEESRALYGATSPAFEEAHFQEIVARLDAAVPGEGSLTERVDAFRKQFVIPTEKLDGVFQAAIAESRRRTRERVELPAHESFVVEYVTDKPWGGYNWYQGNAKSLIQVNTSVPIYIDRAIDLAAHEGYPGHHVYNVLLEQNLVKDRGFVELSVYPLYSPQSLVAEGSAVYGVDVAFPKEERLSFEREVLYPLAGLDPARAGEYQRFDELMKELEFAGNEAARRHLDGRLDRAATKDWLMRYALMNKARAEQRLRFIDGYRSYVINYNVGRHLVRDYVEKGLAGPDVAAARWQRFRELLSSPRLPSTLR